MNKLMNSRTECALLHAQLWKELATPTLIKTISISPPSHQNHAVRNDLRSAGHDSVDFHSVSIADRSVGRASTIFEDRSEWVKPTFQTSINLPLSAYQ